MSAPTIELSPTAVALLKEAAEWRLISLFFECPGPDWASQVAALAGQVTDERLQAAAAVCAEASPGLYHSTFGPGGPAAVREVSYHQDLLPGALLSELRGYYDAFAYRPAACEPPDHLAIEAGFVAFLRMKEAYADTEGDAGGREICAEASRSFIADHLNATAHSLADALARSGVEYLTLAAQALRCRVGGPRPAALRLPIVETGEDDPACAPGI